ncbi:MAG: hypothetical protein PHY90_12660 [Desulfitobacteriaceae bacterium]|nr:hypothetical protein [Desulfitobacteriaceae bacterium]
MRVNEINSIPGNVGRYLLFLAVLSGSVVYFEPAGYDYLFGLTAILMLFSLSVLSRFFQENFLLWLFPAAFIFANFVPLFWSASSFDLLYFGTSAYLFFSALIIAFLLRPMEIRNVFWISTIGLLITCIIGLITFFYGGPFKEIVVGGYRLRCFFKDPNVFAAFVVPHLFFLCSELKLVGKWQRVFVVSFIFILFLGFFLSFSRGGLINLAAGIFVFLACLTRANLFENSKLTCKPVFAVLIFCACFGVFLIWQPGFADTFTKRLHVIDSSNLSRLSAQTRGIAYWADPNIDESFLWSAPVGVVKMEGANYYLEQNTSVRYMMRFFDVSENQPVSIHAKLRSDEEAGALFRAVFYDLGDNIIGQKDFTVKTAPAQGWVPVENIDFVTPPSTNYLRLHCYAGEKNKTLQVDDIFMEGARTTTDTIPLPPNAFFRILFGFGPGCYEDIASFSAHSIYARTLVENGIFGLGAFLIFLAIVLKELYQKRDNRFALVILCSIVGILVQGLVIDTIHWRHFFSLLGMAAVLPRHGELPGQGDGSFKEMFML